MQKRCLLKDFKATPGVMRLLARPRIRWTDNVNIHLNPVTPELSPSAQRCLTRVLLGIGFLNRVFRLYMREKPTNATIIYSVY
jgi:hypothetical protein